MYVLYSCIHELCLIDYSQIVQMSIQKIWRIVIFAIPPSYTVMLLYDLYFFFRTIQTLFLNYLIIFTTTVYTQSKQLMA